MAYEFTPTGDLAADLTKIFEDASGPAKPMSDAEMAAAEAAAIELKISGGTPFETDPLNIKMNGVQSVGVINTLPKSDHIHPSDTSKQPLNANLTAIAELTPSENDIIQRIGGSWVSRTITQLMMMLNLSGTNTGDQDLSGKADKTNVLQLNNTTVFTPAADYEPATKKFVDAVGDGIIESGSNTNGRYIKYRDGTMICWGEQIFIGDGGLYKNVVITYPATFSSASRPVISCFNDSAGLGRDGVYQTWTYYGNSSCNVGIRSLEVTNPPYKHYVQYYLAGRWKA